MSCIHRLTDEQIAEIKDDLRGTCQSAWSVAANMGLEEHLDEIEDRLLDGVDAIELCVVCEWWHEVSELEFDEERNGGVCSQCDPVLHGEADD